MLIKGDKHKDMVAIKMEDIETVSIFPYWGDEDTCKEVMICTRSSNVISLVMFNEEANTFINMFDKSIECR